MKRILSVLIICLLFSGCTSGTDAMDDALQFRRRLTESENYSFECTVTADYNDYIYSFSMQCNFDRQGNMEFSVLEPDTISGITGKMDSDGGKFTFDDQVLMFPMLADGYISPISAPWLISSIIRGGYIHSAVKTDNGLHFIYHDSFYEEPVQLEVFTDSSGNLKDAEILWQGRRILTLTVRNFSYM